MDAKFAERRDELLAECEVDPEVFRQVAPRLTRFLDPFVRAFRRPEPRQHAQIFVSGLMSDLKRKNTESIACRFGRDRLGLQRFIGWAEWDDAPLRSELARQVGAQIGEDDGVIVFDPSAFPKSGKQSVGVARQWCGRLGKVDNCQVGVYMGYASSQGHTLVDTRLYLPKEWTDDKPRMQQAGVPKDRQTHRTRHELALQMLDESGPLLPHSWITGDDEMGRPYWFRKRLHLQGERYLLAVPSNLLLRDLDSAEPEYSGRGRRPKRPWRKIRDIASEQPDDGWTEVEVRDASKGPLVVELFSRRVVGRTSNRQEGHEERLVVIRWRHRDDNTISQTDAWLSDATPDVTLSEFARVAKAEQRIEECLQRGKSQTGLADYEVRNWKGWHHHQTLSLIATWFLTTETRRGKKMDPGDHATANPERHRPTPASRMPVRHNEMHSSRMRNTVATKRTRSSVPLETT